MRIDFKCSVDNRNESLQKKIKVDKFDKNQHFTRTFEMIQPEKSPGVDTFSQQLKKYKTSHNLQSEKSDILDFMYISGNSECNPLANSPLCFCDPALCITKHWTRQLIICYCARSFIKGNDGVIYHSKCNCCGGD